MAKAKEKTKVKEKTKAQKKREDAMKINASKEAKK
jgi:hypothetical protein